MEKGAETATKTSYVLGLKPKSMYSLILMLSNVCKILYSCLILPQGNMWGFMIVVATGTE
jgi:hypothetical protein